MHRPPPGRLQHPESRRSRPARQTDACDRDDVSTTTGLHGASRVRPGPSSGRRVHAEWFYRVPAQGLDGCSHVFGNALFRLDRPRFFGGDRGTLSWRYSQRPARERCCRLLAAPGLGWPGPRRSGRHRLPMPAHAQALPPCSARSPPMRPGTSSSVSGVTAAYPPSRAQTYARPGSSRVRHAPKRSQGIVHVRSHESRPSGTRT